MAALDPAIAADLGALLHELSQNPKSRKIIAKAIKEASTDSPVAKLHIDRGAFKDVEIEERFEALNADREREQLERQQKEVLDRMNAQRSRLLTGGSDGTGRKYAEDDVKKIEELMQRKGISDYDDGATLYAATLPPMDPNPNTELPSPHGATWEFPEWAKFGPDPDKAARNTAHGMITEFMRKR